MEARVVEFVEVLRQNGLRVAISESRDAVEAIATTGVEDPELFRSALEASLCKRAADVETFNRAFDLFFTGAIKMLQEIDRSLADRIREEGLLEGDELKMIVWMLDRLAGQLSPLTQAMMQGNRGQLASLFRQATLQIDFSRVQNALQTGFFSRRLLSGAGFEQTRSDLDTINAELQARGVSSRGVEIVGKHLSAAMRRVEEAARAEAGRQIGARLKKSQGNVADKQLHLLSRQEIEIAQRAVRALAEKLKARLIRRQRSRKRGQLNPRRTLRKNLSAGGVPMVPQFKTRRPARPDVVVLCDVSDSVRVTSRMMVLFTFTLQSLFSRVRSFIFVSELGEVTTFFKDARPEEAIDAATQSGVISLASNSNYGHAFAEFNRTYLGSISRRTTVLVIGDGRNNHNPANVWALEDVKRKAKRVVWICTEPRQNWGFGDSEMLRYEKAVSQVVTVQTLSDLERIAQQLIPV
ncbi:MAG: VWA domain-containing protein [Archangiaceae bacterium]|nr:VWA domain-containing protein [Archangiaceae bacterium]